MAEFEIRNIEDLLKDYLGTRKRILKTETSPLTGPGENYGSIMLRLDVTVENQETGAIETLHTVAKILPKNDQIREMFNVQVTSKTEAAVYTVIVPILKQFQKEVGVEKLIDWAAEVYGARFNLNGSDVVDEDACLVLENLQLSGFRNISRKLCFDLETAQMVLRSLAEFHGVPLALKFRKPEIFEQKIKRNLAGLRPNDNTMDTFVRKLLDQNAKFISKFPDMKVFHQNPPIREPFATITHNDLWINNTMQKFVDGKPLANKFVDFQALEYGSPAGDVFFYIFTSVQVDVLEHHLDNLLQYYHQHLLKVLKEHGCDTSPFNYEAFMHELKLQSKYELGHAICFATLVHLSEKTKKEHAEMKEPPSVENMLDDVTENGRRAAYFIADVCLERGWY